MRTPRSPVPWLLLLTLPAGCGGGAGDASAASRPNVLFLLSDDQSHDTLSCAGHPVVRTPNLDRLAEQGARFANAFVTTSLCSPARASFLTGQYARRHGVLDNETALPRDAWTFASSLGAAGYETAWYGKWHLGGIHEGGLPGFRRAVGYRAQGKYRDCTFYRDGQAFPTRGFVDDVTTDLALEFLREPREAPFLLCVGFKAPHGPRVPDRRHRALYAEATFDRPPNAAALPPYPRQSEWELLGGGSADFQPSAEWAADFGERALVEDYEAEKGEALRKYLRLVTAIDENVGRLLEALDELDLAGETLVVYASDNGYSNGEHGMGGKRSAYEESMRVALIVRDPRIAATGSAVEGLALNVDVGPTLLDLAGVPIPAGMQGRSLRPLLEGGADPWREDFLYEYFREPGFAEPTILGVRGERWKLVTYPDYPEWTQLFDLDADPFETVDLADRADELARLAARLTELEEQAGPRPR